MKRTLSKYALPSAIIALSLAGIASLPPVASGEVIRTTDYAIEPLCAAIGSRYENNLDCITTQSKSMLLVFEVNQTASLIRREDVINALCLEVSMDPDLGLYNFEEAVGCLIRHDIRTGAEVERFFASVVIERGDA